MLEPARQRSRLGALCALFGALLLVPVALSGLSAYGPTAFSLSGAAWSRLFFGQFVALVALGYGYLFARAAKEKVFHGGPMIDFSIGLAGAMIAFGFGRGWVPALFLLAFGLRLSTGRPLLP
jgi:hypothetical protein